ncbi:MAG: glycine cleavage system protein GcvH [Acidobacteriota bacterium]|nr:glycine cleavage system protein GcvH [Acidobacteriota bacterium]
MNPTEYLYSKDHGWILVEGDIGTVGMTDYAQGEMGAIERLDLPEVEDAVEAGEPYGSVESGKAVTEIFSPVTGEVTAVNPLLPGQPGLLNQSPYQDGWIIKVRIERPEELKELFGVEKYEEYLQA